MTETKQCPFCAETIQAAANKCRFCGEWINSKAKSDFELLGNDVFSDKRKDAMAQVKSKKLDKSEGELPKGCNAFDALFMVPMVTTGIGFIYGYGYLAYIKSPGIAEFLLALVGGFAFNIYAGLLGGITGLLIGLGVGLSLTVGRMILLLITLLIPIKYLQSWIVMVGLLIIGGMSAHLFTNIVTKSGILSELPHSTINVARVISIIVGLMMAFSMGLVNFESGKPTQKETDRA